MSVTAHAAGGGGVSPVLAGATAIGAASITASALRGRLTPDRPRRDVVVLLGVVVMLNQLVGHVVMHAGHLVSMASSSTTHHDHAAMSASGHRMPMSDADLSMLVPSHAMLGAHAVGAVLAAVLLASAFGLADRIGLARRRIVSRPPRAVAVAGPPVRGAASIGRPVAGHVRLPHSRGPPSLLV
jgi:hypothetical protein